MNDKQRVTGIGGIFFKSKNNKDLMNWYGDKLGLPVESWGGTIFNWRDFEKPENKKYSVFNVFSDDTDYFNPSESKFMINFRVDDLRKLVDQLKQEGVEVNGVEDTEQGLFAWVIDTDGNKIELWQQTSE